MNLNSLFKSCLLAMAVSILSISANTGRHLYIYNWSNFISPSSVPEFEKQTGIDVVYDVYDSNEVLEAKLLSGRTGYDVVFPSLDFLAHQIKAGVYATLDKSKLPNIKNMDPQIMKLLETSDPSNLYAIPYLAQTTGIGINPAKVKQSLGKDAPLDSWALIFEPENMKKLSQCGVAFLDAPTEVLPLVLKYMGKDPNSKNPKDYKLAADKLAKVVPYITYFHSSKYLSDLANGDICVALGWSGDMFMAGERAREAGNGVKVDYIIPKEGAAISYDVMAVPANAANKESAYRFINYMMEPSVIAGVTDYVYFANPNKAATPLVNAKLRNNKGIYPSTDVEKNLFIFKPLPSKAKRMIFREWTRMKTGT
ncbi:MAG: extracellular solute-binding protein [Endozoicomonadaceae bacterium]|nr:extracellular solute-binding protein [Endozoicomonadaceae bacterium]